MDDDVAPSSVELSSGLGDEPPSLEEAVSARSRARSRASRPSKRLQSPLEQTDPLAQLVSLQHADGTWDLSPRLAALLGKPRETLLAALPSSSFPPELAVRIWATSLALAWLQRHQAATEDEWSLLAGKARHWLAAHAGGKALMEAAEALLGG